MITEGSTAIRARATSRAGSARSSREEAEEAGAPGVRPRRARRDDADESAPTHPHEHLLWRRVAWLAFAVLWAFLALSLLSYSSADAPATTVYPHNQPPANLCGKAGALVAHYAYQLLGYGAPALLALAALWLGVSATGRRVNQVPVRILGAIMMAASVSGFQALLLPSTGPVPALPGGLVGTLGGGKLIESFSSAGTFLILLLMLCVGAIVALDVWAVLAAIWTGRALYASAKTSGRVAVAAARVARERSQVIAQARAARRQETDAYGYRPDDVSDDRQLPELADSRTSRVLRVGGAGPVRPAARAARPASSEEHDDLSLFDPAGGGGAPVANPKMPVARAASPVVDDPDAEDAGITSPAGAAPAQPREYSADELRAKIAKLPVRFAANTSRSATDEDLREVQGGGTTAGMNIEGYRFPGLDLLEEPEMNFSQTMEAFVREQAEALERALNEYKIDGEVVGVESGPVITLYEVRLAPGTKVAALQAIASDLARSLKAINIRIVPNTVGRDTVGVEVPNAQKEKVRLKELMTRSDIHSRMTLPMFLGKDASGEPLICDLATMPHLLIAGTTGSGKSVCMNTVIMSFLYTKKPNELKLVLVDPKMVELSQFKDIPHLMCPVVTEMGKAAAILEWAVAKMDERYELLAEAGCRDITGYNALEWEEIKDRLNITTPEEEAKVPRKLPYMVFIIDELADLMMTNKEVEHSIVRIAQKARAVGMHLIVATQRPQANVVTGLIKSNMPARCAFKVASGMDSRIVLDQKGGELLLGQGDMLYLSPRSSKLTRAQGTLVDDKEIRRVVKFLRDVATPTFERSLLQIRPGMSPDQAEGGPGPAGAAGYNGNFNMGDRDGFQAAQEDPMFDQAVEIVIESRRGSVSMLQRRLAIGYTRAARLIEMMGEAGILGGHKGTVSRDVIMTLDEWHAIKAQAQADAAAKGAGQADDGLRGGPGGELNSHPATGETLEVMQARVNGTGGDGGRTSAARATELPGAADDGSEVDEYEDDELDEGDDLDGEHDEDDEIDGEIDDEVEQPPFTVHTRKPGNNSRV